MAVHHGKNGKVKLGSNLVGETTSWSINEAVDTADTTAMQDTSQTHLAGIPGWSGSINANYDPADTNGQNVLLIGASVTIGLYSDGDATTKKYFAGTATITGISREVNMGDTVKCSFAIKGNGALTLSTVP